MITRAGNREGLQALEESSRLEKESVKVGASGKRRLSSRTSLSVAEVRRAILYAQGFGNRSSGRVTQRHLLATCRRIGMLQIDSVNVLVRAHYFPLFSRLGPYQVEFLDELSAGLNGFLTFAIGLRSTRLPTSGNTVIMCFPS